MLLCKYSEMRVFSTAELFRVDGQIITSTPQICQRIKYGADFTSKAVAAAAVTAWVASATAQTTAVTAAAERLYAEARGMYAKYIHRGDGVCAYVGPA